MSTGVPPNDLAERHLRDWLASADPEAGRTGAVPEHLWARVLDEVAVDPASAAVAAAGGRSPGESSGTGPATGAARSAFLRRHWQGGLLAAAGVASIALAAGTVLPGLSTGPDGAGVSAVLSQEADEVGAGAGSLTGGSTAPDTAGSGVDSGATTPGSAVVDPTLVRTASVLVGCDDVRGARGAFLASIRGLGGTVTSEAVVTDGSGGLPVGDGATSGSGVSLPSEYPSGPGVWLTVRVPAAAYEQAVDAARAQGDLVRLQQTSYDAGTQVTDTAARIASLSASLDRLKDLLTDADGVSEVIRVEEAIAGRQAELDSLRAQQRELADQTRMSQISAAFMTPQNARRSVDPDRPPTWWESVADAAGRLWDWLGHALLVLSPLLIAWAVIRRSRRRAVAVAPTADAPAAERASASDPGSRSAPDPTRGVTGSDGGS